MGTKEKVKQINAFVTTDGQQFPSEAQAIKAQAKADLYEIIMKDDDVCLGETDVEDVVKCLVNRAKEIIELVALAAGIELEKVDV